MEVRASKSGSLRVVAAALVAAFAMACGSSNGSATNDGSEGPGNGTASGGSDEASGSSANGASGGGSSAPALTCDTTVLCSSDWVQGTVASLPARAGGTIADGRYTLVDILSPNTAYESLRAAFVVRGGSIQTTGAFAMGSIVGSIAVEKTKVAITRTQYCRGTGAASDLVTGDPETYDYTADGDRLYLFDDTSFSHGDVREPVALVYQRFDGDLCKGPGATVCTIKSCFCASKIGGTLDDATCHLDP